MPELPEVETIRRGLQRRIKNKQIKDIVINVDKIIKKLSLGEFIAKIKGKKIPAMLMKLTTKPKFLLIRKNIKRHYLIWG